MSVQPPGEVAIGGYAQLVTVGAMTEQAGDEEEDAANPVDPLLIPSFSARISEALAEPVEELTDSGLGVGDCPEADFQTEGILEVLLDATIAHVVRARKQAHHGKTQGSC